MQLELKSSGLVEGLSSAEMNQLGEIIYMGTVSVGDDDELNDDQLLNDRLIWKITLFLKIRISLP